MSDDSTDGSINDDGITIQFCGKCPVQGIGIVDGRSFYYRSRGNWTFEVLAGAGPPVSPTWICGGNHASGDQYGGFAKAATTIDNIRRAVALWRESGRP